MQMMGREETQLGKPPSHWRVTLPPPPPNAPSLFQALGQLGWKLLLCDAKVVRSCWLWSNWCEVVVLKSKSMFAVGKLASEQLTRWTGTATLKQLSFEMYHGILDCTQICNLKSIATTYEMSWLWWQCRKHDTTQSMRTENMYFSRNSKHTQVRVPSATNHATIPSIHDQTTIHTTGRVIVDDLRLDTPWVKFAPQIKFKYMCTSINDLNRTNARNKSQMTQTTTALLLNRLFAANKNASMSETNPNANTIHKWNQHVAFKIILLITSMFWHACIATWKCLL